MLNLFLPGCCLIFTIKTWHCKTRRLHRSVSFLEIHAVSRWCCSWTSPWHITVFRDRFPLNLGQICHFTFTLLLLAVTFGWLVPPPTCITQLQGNLCPKAAQKLILEWRSDHLLLLQSNPNAVLRTIQIFGFPEVKQEMFWILAFSRRFN